MVFIYSDAYSTISQVRALDNFVLSVDVLDKDFSFFGLAHSRKSIPLLSRRNLPPEWVTRSRNASLWHRQESSRTQRARRAF